MSRPKELAISGGLDAQLWALRRWSRPRIDRATPGTSPTARTRGLVGRYGQADSGRRNQVSKDAVTYFESTSETWRARGASTRHEERFVSLSNSRSNELSTAFAAI